MTTHPAQPLHDASVEAPARRFSFTPTCDRLVCVDSDGCVFDTMEIKQKRRFHGLIAEHWRLHPIERAVTATIGDSPGDEQAADAAGVRFFPEAFRAVFHARLPDLGAFRSTP